jgi:hypothetical protein
MALQLQVVPVEIATGIDTKTDPKKVTGKLIALINAVFHQSKALLKRFGYQSLSQSILGGSSIASGATISPYQNELVELDGESLYSFSDQQTKWVNKGTLPVCTLSVSSIVKNSRGQTTQDQAQHSSGFQVFTWEDTAGGSYYSVIDTGTGQTLVNSVLLSATAYVPKPITIGNYIVIFYYDTSNTSLRYQAINMSTPTSIGSVITVAGSTNQFNVPVNSCIYDAALIGSYIHIALATTSGISFFTLSSALALVNPATFTTTDVQNIAIFGDASNNAWVAYFRTVDAIYVTEYTNQFASITLAHTAIDSTSNFTTLRNLTGIVIGTTAHVFYESDQLTLFNLGTINVFYGNFIRSNTITTGGSVGTSYNVIRSLGIASKPFVYNGIIYMLGVYDATRTSLTPGQALDPSTESTCFLVDLNGNVAAKLAQLNGGGVSKKFIAPEALTISSVSFQVSYLLKDILISNGGNVFTQTGVQSAVINFSAVFPSKLQIGKALLLGGGILRQYDGAIPTEQNFHLYPELMTYWIAQVGGAQASGSYEYQSLYEWTDNQGQINRSSTSDPIVVPIPVLEISVATTNSSATALANITPLYSAPVSFFNMDIGYAINGTGITSGTTVGSRSITGSSPVHYNIFLSAAATSTVTENNVTVIPLFYVTGSTNDLFNTMTIDPIGYLPLSVQNSYAGNVSYITAGMTADQNITGGGGVTLITAIDPVSRLITPSVGAGNFPSVVRIYKQFTGTWTNGSNTVTGVTASSIFALLNAGDTGAFSGGSNPFTIASWNASAGTITMTLLFTGTTGSYISNVNFPASDFLIPGQTISGTGIQTGTTIQTITAPAAGTGQETTITLSAIAVSTQSEVSYTIGNLYGVSVQMPTLRVTNKTTVSDVLYRTQDNQTLLYRSTPITTPTINSTTEDFAYLFDAVSDITLVGNQQLYTTGGEVDNSSPPSSSAICTYKNRAVLIPNESPLTFWYSKQVIPGSPVEFSENFIENVDSLGGPMFAPVAMDDKLILFKANNIFYVVGEGPTPAGTQNDFSDAQLIATDTGCSNPASIVLTPQGLMFQSPKGIYLLARNMTVNYIGAEVEAYNSYTVTSAVLMENVNQVRFSISNGTDLVYDYYFGQWSIFTNISAVDACLFNGVYTYLSSAGLVNQENTSYTDNGAFIQLSATTSWMSFANLQGFQRIWRLVVLGNYKSPHTLQINTAVDFSPTFEQNTSIPVMTAPNIYEYRIHMKQQKCTSIQFQIQDSQSSAFGEGFQLSEITLEVGMKVGTNKLSAGSSY